MTFGAVTLEAGAGTPLLDVERLSVRFRLGRPGRRQQGAVVCAVTDVSFALQPGQLLALVGESGCGKSVLASALLGLLPANADVRGHAVLTGSGPAVDLVDAPESELAGRVRGRRIGLVPQAAMSAVLLLPHAVWHETALSFLGLGLPPHLASLGNILGDGRDAVLLGAWWIVVFPSALLVAATLAVSGIASVWRDRLVPRRRSELAL